MAYSSYGVVHPKLGPSWPTSELPILTPFLPLHLTISCLRLTTWGQGGEGRIRLSVDDGPSAREFLDDDYDEDNERLGDDEPLAVTAQRLRDVGPPAEPSTEPVAQSTLVFEAETEEPPPPPAKP